MPLIVKELIVKATVQDSAGERKIKDNSTRQDLSIERESIIQDAVEQVLEILDRQKDK